MLPRGRAVEPLSLITAAVAPIVMLSATGLLFIGLQTRNLPLADRMRELAKEHRNLPAEPRRAQRREAQLRLFERRICLSQRALELLYIALVGFIVTALLLAAMPWLELRSLP
jgi:multisubunit Na+/H+ antiporter MnhB subunit